MMQTVRLQLFLKGGGDEIADIPKSLFFDLAKSIQKNGSENLHLASGKSLLITGFMITGREFNQESRIIVVEGKSP